MKSLNKETIDTFKKGIISHIENNFIGANVHKLKTPISTLQFLDFNVEGISDQGYPQLSLAVKEKVLQTETYQISVNIPREQTEILSKDYNIDIIVSLLNIITNEFNQNLNKQIIKTIDKNAEEYLVEKENKIPIQYELYEKLINFLFRPFKKNFIEQKYDIVKSKVPVEFTSVKKMVNYILAMSNLIASKCRRGPGNFVICNNKIAVALQKFEGCTLKTTKISTGIVYELGSINGIKFFVDPNMRWDADYLYVGRIENNKNKSDSIGLNIGYLEDYINIDLLYNDSPFPIDTPKLIMRSRMFVEDVPGKSGHFIKLKYDDSLLEI